MLSFMRAQYTLFQQGYNILDEIDPYMKKLAAQVCLISIYFPNKILYTHLRIVVSTCCVHLFTCH